MAGGGDLRLIQISNLTSTQSATTSTTSCVCQELLEKILQSWLRGMGSFSAKGQLLNQSLSLSTLYFGRALYLQKNCKGSESDPSLLFSTLRLSCQSIKNKKILEINLTRDVPILVHWKLQITAERNLEDLNKWRGILCS